MWKPGTVLGGGRYNVVGALGRGDPDGVFEVVDGAGRHFAMRSPIGDVEESGDAVTKQFLPIGEQLRKLAHMNLVALFDVFVDKGQLFFITEKVNGRTLTTALDGEVFPRKALVFVRQMLEATAHAHAANVVHGNLQPSKVMLVAMQGWELTKIADFGLAPLINEAILEHGNAVLIGSVPKPAATYMAPEQVLGRSVDARTDLYSIGVMLFEMLTGRPPFPDRDPELVRELHVRVPPPKLDELCRGAPWCTPPVLNLVETALAKDREQRYPTAIAMREAVDEAFGSLQHLPPES